MGIRPFSWGSFGNVPDPPEPMECNDEFDDSYCEGCSQYDECRRIAEEEYPHGLNPWQE